MCLDENDLREVLGEEGKVTLLCIYTCYCYDGCPRASQVFDLHAPGPITARDVIAFLTQIGYDPVCNHRCLEGFNKIRDGVVELSMIYS